MFKQKNGITLIALVITIIVLLILAGVVINLTMGENGIIGKTQNSANKYKQASVNEQTLIAKYENEIEGYISSNRDYELEINKLKSRIAELENLNSYSATEEKVVGTWVNGKPIYQTVLDFGECKTTSGRNWHTFNTNRLGLNIENVIDAKVLDGGTSVLNYLDVVVSSDGSQVSLYLNTGDVIGARFVIIQYTKTTPTPTPNGN